MRTSCVIAFAVLAFTSPSLGQIPKSGNAFFGYSYSGGQIFNGGPVDVHMNGWEGTVEGKFLPWLGGVADFDWHYAGADVPCTTVNCSSARIRENASRHSLLFGPRVSTAVGRYSPFAQALFGLTHQTEAGVGNAASDNSFASALGGGVDYRLVKSAALRFQADWIHTSRGGSRNDLRVSTGIVFHF